MSDIGYSVRRRLLHRTDGDPMDASLLCQTDRDLWMLVYCVRQIGTYGC